MMQAHHQHLFSAWSTIFPDSSPTRSRNTIVAASTDAGMGSLEMTA
jgi:hypothetical protein